MFSENSNARNVIVNGGVTMVDLFDKNVWEKLDVGECIEVDWEKKKKKMKTTACRVSTDEIIIKSNFDGKDRIVASIKKTKMR